MAGREVLMTFPLPLNWEVISRAVGAVYDSDGDYTGYDITAGDVIVEADGTSIRVVYVPPNDTAAP